MDDRLQEAQLMIGLLEYDRADELLRGVLRDADAAGDDATASLALEALGTIATRRGREAVARDLLVEAIARGGMPDPAERTQLYWDLARIHSGLGEAGRRDRPAAGRTRRGWATTATSRPVPASASPSRTPARTPATTLAPV